MATFRRVAARDFRASIDQVVALGLLGALFALAASWLTSEPPRDFYLPAIESRAFRVVLTLGFAYLATLGARAALTLLCVVLLSPLLFEWTLYTLVDLATLRFDVLADEPWVSVADAVLWGWFGAVVYRALRVAGAFAPLRSGLTAALYLAVLWQIQGAIPGERFFETDTWSDADAEVPAIDAERVLYAQPAGIDAAVAALLPGRPGTTDLYFVGFAGDGTQDVFMREVDSAQELFDRRFGTAGRSIALINNAETLDSAPVASATNLGELLVGVGERMNRDEDVLFLFLTAHGSSDPELSVYFPPLPLNPIAPADLAAMLDRARIRWRVVVVSACYSGGFVDALADEHSLVIAAAAPDRESFGCSHEADFTYFGGAYFRDELSVVDSFTAAFEGARERIAALEESDGLEPSYPQMALGRAMARKLRELEQGFTSD